LRTIIDMPRFDSKETPKENWILAALDPEERRSLNPFLERVPMDWKEVFFEPHEPIRHVHFIESGVASLVTPPMEEGTIIEVATVGNEGIVGLPVFLGAESVPSRCLCQVPGEALRMTAADFRDATAKPGQLRDLVNLYVQTLFNQIAQSGACNRAHGVEERASRWLLMTQDRVGDQFPLPQEFLGQMLGVRRGVVNLAVGRLRQAGFIDYDEGFATILDRRGLEGCACECYAIIRRELDRLQPVRRMKQARPPLTA
jgi:CRP-like cAMP-binding protein